MTLVTALVMPTLALAQPDPVTHRPLSDFLSQQGTFCPSLPHVNCPGFGANYLGFTGYNPQLRDLGFPLFYDRFGGMDYAGIEPVAGALGTTTTGTVTERRRTDGKYEVRIQLHTRNAYAQVRRLNFVTPPPEGVNSRPI